MSDKEVKIGNKIIGENTTISLSIKTALWAIGGTIALFSTLFSLAYFDIKSDVKQYKEKVDQEKIEYFDKVNDKLNVEIDKMRDRNDDIIKDIGDIKGNVKVILDRTSGIKNNSFANTPENSTPPPLPAK